MAKKAFVRYSTKGKIVPGSLIVTGGSCPKGPAKWAEVPVDICCEQPSNDYTKDFVFKVGIFYDKLGNYPGACHSYLRELITGINLFYDQGSDGMIDDGGRDMYDNGNALNTNLTQVYDAVRDGGYNSSLNIPYTHTQASTTGSDMLYANPPLDGTIQPGDSYFGTGSLYFTNMYPGFFILAADGLTGVTEFTIAGNLGSDGYGTNFYYKQPTSYVGWNAYCKTNNDEYIWGDCSVNHLILVKGDSTSTTQTGNTDGEWDDHAVQGLDSTNTSIIYVLFSTMPGMPAVTAAQFRALADGVLETAAGQNPCNLD